MKDLFVKSKRQMNQYFIVPFPMGTIFLFSVILSYPFSKPKKFLIMSLNAVRAPSFSGND